MTQQYVPKYRETKVHEAIAASKICDVRAGKPKGWEFVDQYFSYEAWEAKDDDFMIFHGVISRYEIPEISITEYETVPETQIPNGAVVLEKLKLVVAAPSNLIPAAPLPATATPATITSTSSSALNPPKRTSQPILPSSKMDTTGRAHPEMQKQASTSTSASSAVIAAVDANINNGGSLLPGVQYVKVSRNRVVGPVGANARFESLSMHRNDQEGLLKRGSGKTAYSISLHSDGSQQVPRLLRDHKPQ